jgi:hypothetical protein
MMRGASFNIFDWSEPQPEPEECPYSREDLFPWPSELPKKIDISGIDWATDADKTTHVLVARDPITVLREMSDSEFEAYKSGLLSDEECLRLTE